MFLPRVAGAKLYFIGGTKLERFTNLLSLCV